MKANMKTGFASDVSALYENFAERYSQLLGSNLSSIGSKWTVDTWALDDRHYLCSDDNDETMMICYEDEYGEPVTVWNGSLEEAFKIVYGVVKKNITPKFLEN